MSQQHQVLPSPFSGKVHHTAGACVGSEQVKAQAVGDRSHPGAELVEWQIGSGAAGAGVVGSAVAPHAFSTSATAARAIVDDARRDMDLDLCWGRRFERRLFGLGTQSGGE